MGLHNTGKEILMAALMCGLFICSCKKDDPISINKEPSAGSGVVTFDIASSGVWAPDVIEGADEVATRSNVKYSESVPMDCEGDGQAFPEEVYIYMIEDDNSDDTMLIQPQTKVEEAADRKVLYGIYAYMGNGTASEPTEGIETFMDNLEFYDDGTYSGGNKYWPGKGHWLQFYAYSPYLTKDATKANYIENREGKSPVIHYTVSEDITKHDDILTGKSGKIDGSVTDPVAIEVSHILSKIQVKVGSVAAGKITSLKISGVNDKAEFSLADNKWMSITSSDAIENVVYEQTFDQAQENNTLLGEPMYLIPQDMPASAKIELTVVVNGNPYTLSKQLNQFITGWSKDKQYTFVISTPHEVEVEVTDEVVMDGTYPVKQNLKIKNTGLADAYIRVAIVGSWVVDEGDKTIIVSDWKETDGTYDWTGKSDKWEEHTDGYYYYLDPIAPGAEAGQLFKSYTLTVDAPPILDSYLQMTILVQAVHEADRHMMFPPAVNAMSE